MKTENFSPVLIPGTAPLSIVVTDLPLSIRTALHELRALLYRLNRTWTVSTKLMGEGLRPNVM